MSRVENLAKSQFTQFISSMAGRIVRIVFGIILIAGGFILRHQTIGIVLMIFGLLPLFAGLFDICVLTGIIGNKWSGKYVRQCARAKD